MRRGLRNSARKPSRNRSSAERLGARRRERLITRSCCFMRRLSATTAFAPPGPRNFATVVNKWARSISRSFMGEQGREAHVQEQDCPSCSFQVIISNSPTTRITACRRAAFHAVWFVFTVLTELSAHLQAMCSILQRDYQGHWVKRALGKTSLIDTANQQSGSPSCLLLLVPIFVCPMRCSISMRPCSILRISIPLSPTR